MNIKNVKYWTTFSYLKLLDCLDRLNEKNNSW